MSPLTTLLFFTLIFKLCSTQNSNNCKSKETCSECIQELGCIWCISPKNQIHCMHKNESSLRWCNVNSIVNPAGSFRILQNSELTSVGGEAVQIKPQRIKLTLRKGEEYVLPFQYAQAANYPVDLYYLMDLSASMEPHREKLAKLGDKLAKTMMNITDDFRLGFGSFVDKVDLPFVSTVPEELKEPCRLTKPSGQVVHCVPPYSFKNHMSLSTNYQKFSSEVSSAQVSGNLDLPEGGFDGLMQAIVCKSEIGWRTQARHLLVFSSDAEFHIAGDGKLAGIVEPNDAQCHMKNNLYTHDLVLDYSSVSQINYIAKQNNINLIFAIVNKKRIVDIYKRLSQEVENSKMGILDKSSKNVIKLLVENYNKIVDSVTLSTNSSNDVDVKISSNCPNPKANGCTNIHVGEIVNFTATIKPLECTKSTRKTISIKPEAIDESIIIDLEVLCDCECESAESELHTSKSKNCSSSGTLKCEVCDCDPGFFGRTCECNRKTSNSEDVSNCKPNNQTDTKICSSLGVCKCGQCQCNERKNRNEKIYGKYCDCDNYSCKRIGGKLCSEQDTCGCGGECRCHAGWTGDACQCPDTKNSCIKPNSDLICNGHGTCDCGRCQCFDEQVRYSGKYCDECPTCSGQRCEELRHCVECQVHKSGAYDAEDCRSNCTTFVAEIVKKIDNDESDEAKTCSLVDDKGCTFVFQYEYGDNNELRVVAEKKKFCPVPPNILASVSSVIGSILFAGLIMLVIWKVCTTVHDRREFAKFENERKKSNWHRNDNPLYRQATSSFANPLFGSRPKTWFKKS